MTVKYTKVTAPGKVYIVKSAEATKFNASDSATYVSVSDAVATTATKTVIKNAVTAAGDYKAIYVPDDTTKYGNATSNEFSVTAVANIYTMTKVDNVRDGEKKVVLKATDQFGTTMDAGNPTIEGTQATGELEAINEKDSAAVGAAANVTNTATSMVVTKSQLLIMLILELFKKLFVSLKSKQI